jgi:hypothetical protein
MLSKAMPLTYFSEGLRCSMLYIERIYTSMAILAVLVVVFIIMALS